MNGLLSMGKPHTHPRTGFFWGGGRKWAFSIWRPSRLHLALFSLQLPEPIVPFRMYNALMGAAKESLQGGSDAKGRSGKGGPELMDRGADTDRVVVNLVLKLKELLKELPWENTATLRYLLQHLRR